MKIRNGFVTNSSSSSFILNFTSVHKVREALEKEMLNEETINYLVPIIEEGKVSRKKLTELLEAELMEDVRWQRYLAASRSYPHQDAWANWDNPLEGKWKERYDNRLAEILNGIPEGSFISVIDQDDDSEFGSALEHNILPGLKVVKAFFSHH